jgi:hypothetical protein
MLGLSDIFAATKKNYFSETSDMSIEDLHWETLRLQVRIF